MNRQSGRFQLGIVSLLMVAGLGMVAVSAGLGPLDPPAGPVAPTAKPLSEVEPRIAINATNTPGDTDATPSLFKITQPGSYYLTGNVTGVAGKIGIEIAASGVTIDLNGFELLGVASSRSGVLVSLPSLTRIAVVNGTFRGWGAGGIDTTNGSQSRIEDVTVLSCSGSGIRVGSAATVNNCRAVGNSVEGIVTLSGCVVSNCVMNGNGFSGLTTTGSTISNCTALNNTVNGFIIGNASNMTGCTTSDNGNTGVLAGNVCQLTSCVSTSNSGGGIECGSGCTAVNCTVQGNSSAGVSLGTGSNLLGSSVSNNTRGVVAGNDCTVQSSSIVSNFFGPGVSVTGVGVRIDGCKINGNASIGVSYITPSSNAELTVVNCTIGQNGSGGISSGEQTHVQGCMVTGNGVSVAGAGVSVGLGSSVIDTTAGRNGAGGIVTGAGCTVSRCTAYQNTGNGISVGGSGSVLDCTARVNTLDGIVCTFRCTIRGNTSTSNTLAQYHATDTDNRIEGNTAVSGARGYDIDAAGNIIVRNSTSGATTNWDVVAGNVILVVNAAVAGAISGNTGGVAPGSTDPNANFTY